MEQRKNEISSPSGNTLVIFIESKPFVYGGQRQLLARCAELDRRRVDYLVIHPFTSSLFLDAYRKEECSGKLVAPTAGNWFLATANSVFDKSIRALFILRALRKATSLRDEIVVHSDAFDSAYLVSVAAKTPRFLHENVTKVFSVNSDRYRFFSLLDRTFLPVQDRICTNSEFSRDQLRLYPWLSKFDISVCYSAIDFDALDDVFKRFPSKVAGRSNTISIGYVGSFDRRKQLDQFVRCALTALREFESGFNLEFIVFGTAKDAEQASFEEEVKREISRSRFKAGISFAGYGTPEEVVARVDALLCPFRFEPFGRVVPEFLYLGLDIFLIRDGGLPEAGLGFAHELGALEGEALEREFVTALSDWLVQPRQTADALAYRREKLRSAFGSAAIVDRELKLYNKG